jgi:hypothetical protein
LVAAAVVSIAPLAVAEDATPAPSSAAAARSNGPTTPRVRDLREDAQGVTLHLELPAAPFPASGASYTDASVWVFVPHYVRSRKGEATAALVHFHGHNTSAERALTAHRLREQLVDSKQEAVLIVPQGPLFAADSSAGKLESPGGLARLLEEVFAVLQRPVVAARLGKARPSRAYGRVVVSAHSGGYHAAAQSVKHGGVAINEVYLFDALYAEADVFRDWVLAGRGKSQRERHKLVSYVTPFAATERWTDWLYGELQKQGVSAVQEKTEGQLSREALTRAEFVSIRTASAHTDVTNEWNALRDCLYASALPRHLHSDWFLAKRGRRPLDRR